MTHKEIFVLGARLIGLWAVVEALPGVVAGFGALNVSPIPLVAAATQIAAGIYCLKGAPFAVEIAFPGEPERPGAPTDKA